MNIKIVKNIEEFQNCDYYWGQINNYCNVFTKKEWLISWWENYSASHLLRIYIYMDDDDRVLIILPLMLNNVDGKKVLSQLSDSCSDYFRVLCKSRCDKELSELLQYIKDNEDYDIFNINNLREDDDNTRLLIASAFNVNRNIELSIQESTYYINTSVLRSYTKYYDLKSRNYKHKINHVRKAGQNFEFAVIKNYDDDIVNRILEIHQIKWKAEYQISVFYDLRRLKFVKSICSAFAEKDILRIFILKDNDRIIAYRLGFYYNNVYHDWNTSYDISYSAYSVGILLCDYIIRYCFDHGIKEFDFLRGEENYKKMFATESRNLLSIKIENMRARRENVTLSPKMNTRKILRNINGVLFDLDGVVYKGKIPITNTIEFINYLLNSQIKVGFLTNTSSRCSDSIHNKLQGMGVEEKEYYIETSATATAQYLKETCVKSCVVYGGEGVLASEISELGIIVYDIFDSPDKVDCAVIGYSQQFDYFALARINELLANGALLVSTDEDKLFAHNDTCLPGTSWILSSVEGVTGKKAYVIGKPNSYSAMALLNKMELEPREVLVIGDNMDSDILMAKKIRSSSCLLLGGVSNEGDIAKASKSMKPDIITEDLRELIPYLKKGE